MMKRSELKKYHAAASFAVRMIMKGYQPEQIIRKISRRYKGIDAKIAYEVGKCRIKAKEKFDIWDLMLIDEYGLRYSTPDIVAEYIAKRLSCQVIADLGCGIGAQARHFGKYSSKVICVEIDEKRASFAWWNLEQYGIEFELISGDALDEEVIRKITKEAEIIFSDPSRPEWKKNESFPIMTPDPRKILEKYFKNWDRNSFAFQLPPQLPPYKVPFEGELEYLSLFGKLNRLTVYLGDLRKYERSVVKIPGEFRLISVQEKEPLLEVEKPKSYVYIVDPAVVKAEMIEDLANQAEGELLLYLKDPRRTLLTSSDLVRSPFFESSYEVLEYFDFSPQKANELAKKHSAKKVTLRIKVRPEEYWNIRRRIEEGLSGEEHLYLIEGKGNKAILAKKVAFRTS